MTRLIPLILLSTLLSACGGGGGGDDSSGGDSGGSSSGGTPDTRPDSFEFVDQTNAALSVVVESAAVTVEGIAAAASISITGGEYSINGGVYTSSTGTVAEDQFVTVRQTSSDQVATTTNATLTVGGVNDTFSVTTRSEVSLPTASIVFPAVDGSLVHETTSISVRGTADDDSGVASISVNGVAATTSDNYANWQATVFLTPADEPITLTVEAIDVVGNVNTNADSTTVIRKLGLTACESFGMDTANNRIFVWDFFDGLVEFDLGDNSRRQVADKDAGVFREAIYSPQDQRLYAFDGGDLFEINVETGDQTAVSADGAGGVSLNNIGDLELDDNSNLIYVYDRALQAVVSVNLNNGARAIVSSNSVGGGPAFDSSVFDMGFNNGRLFVTRTQDFLVMEVNLATGVRTVISDNDSDGPDFISLHGIIADVANDTLYKGDISGDFFAVDIDTGEHALLSPTDYANNLLFDQNFHMQFDSVNNRALMFECQAGLLAIDLDGGQRSRVLPADRGTGPPLVDLGAIAYDAARNRVAALSGSSVMGVHAITGDRVMISVHGMAGGPDFVSPFDIAVDTDNDRILVLDNQPGLASIIAVDPDTGVRNVLSSNDGEGGGDLFVDARGFAYVPGSNQLLVADVGADALVLVDLVSGDRTNVSKNGGAGSGPDFSEPMDVAVDVANNQAYVVDRELSALFRVNLSDGTRSIVSSDTIGSGPGLVEPSRVEIDTQRNIAMVGNTLINLLSGDREAKTGLGLGDVVINPVSGWAYTYSGFYDAVGIYDIDSDSGVFISR